MGYLKNHIKLLTFLLAATLLFMGQTGYSEGAAPTSPIMLNGILNITSRLQTSGGEPRETTKQLFVVTSISTMETQPEFIRSAYAVQMYPVEAELWSKAKRTSTKPMMVSQTGQKIATQGANMGIATSSRNAIWPLAPSFHPTLFLEKNRASRSGHYSFQLDNPVKKESPALNATLEIREESQNGRASTFRIVYDVVEQSWSEKGFVATFSTHSEETCIVDTDSGRIMQRNGTLQSEFKTSLGDVRSETINFQLYPGE